MAVAFDPLSAAAMTDPQPLYARLRAEDPVHYLERYDTWALASFDAVWRACSDTTSFSVRRGQMPLQILLGEPATNLTFPELDPPEHRLRRRVLAPVYTRDAAERDAAAVGQIARDVLGPLLAGDGRFDAFGDYAHVVAGRFAATKAGVPLTDADQLRRDISASFRREPGQRGTSEANQAATIAVFTYLHELVADCRRRPERASGLLAELLTARVDGEPLRDEQIAAELHTLMVTGSDTTELGVAATLFHVARDPDQHADLLADPAQSAWAFAEALRFDHPTDVLGCCVRQDVEIGGRTLRAGQGVLLLWGSANRDEAEFPDAARFDLHRRPRRSLIFGHGQHQCIGEHIGMRMGTVMLEELLGAITDYSVDFDGVHRRCGEFLKGYDRVPVVVTAVAHAMSQPSNAPLEPGGERGPSAPARSAESGSDVSDVLDNPVWHALTTHQAALAVGAGGARRYREDVSVFWGAEALDDAGWAALAELAGPGAGVVLARDRLPDPPAGWQVLGGGAGHQMIATALSDPRAGAAATAEIRPLTPDDVGEMLALTALTQPGPFLAGTIELGGYVGVFDGEQLVAMAGERMHLPDHTEISAVCTHPDHRGRGLAGALTRRVADTIVDRGETPILHVRDGNDDAIRVYERLGFTVRKTIEFFWYRAPG